MPASALFVLNVAIQLFMIAASPHASHRLRLRFLQTLLVPRPRGIHCLPSVLGCVVAFFSALFLSIPCPCCDLIRAFCEPCLRTLLVTTPLGIHCLHSELGYVVAFFSALFLDSSLACLCFGRAPWACVASACMTARAHVAAC